MCEKSSTSRHLLYEGFWLDAWRQFCPVDEDGELLFDIHQSNERLLRTAIKHKNRDAVEFLLRHGATVHESWEEEVDNKMKHFIADHQPLGIKSASKLS